VSTNPIDHESKPIAQQFDAAAMDVVPGLWIATPEDLANAFETSVATHGIVLARLRMDDREKLAHQAQGFVRIQTDIQDADGRLQRFEPRALHSNIQKYFQIANTKLRNTEAYDRFIEGEQRLVQVARLNETVYPEAGVARNLAAGLHEHGYKKATFAARAVMIGIGMALDMKIKNEKADLAANPVLSVVIPNWNQRKR
jgi:hypothetical protein